MRTSYIALGALLAVLSAPVIAASIENMPYPGSVALSQDRPGVWMYKSFPAFLPLYVFDGEPSGGSSCDTTCAAVWPIVKADANAKPMGDWTVVHREDGRNQWAFKGRAVYMYFEDSSSPLGVGKEQDWYLEEGAIAFLVKAGVTLPSDFKVTDQKRSGKKAIATLLRP